MVVFRLLKYNMSEVVLSGFFWTMSFYTQSAAFLMLIIWGNGASVDNFIAFLDTE